ncbi:DUF6493 family protein [Actinomadura oligospora]|uniref:DUF7824 domain-containing protein n=1 Tax=Actinomadura oligospora TaxID=111804 RepID=UPI00047D156E|nr:DUF6493 family protein [Actinomadura oligospora]
MNAQVREAIRQGDSEDVLSLIAELGTAERRTVAKELPGLLREVRDQSQYGLIDGPVADALLLAGLATIGGASAAANWMARTDLLWWTRRWAADGRSTRQAPLVDAVADRPDEWVADVVERAAGRLRTRWQHEGLWRAIAALVPRAGGVPPTNDTFVLGWTQWAAHPKKLADDPFTDTLLPRVFEVDGAGHEGWAKGVAELTASGRVRREDVLDRCVRRLLRGGRIQDLRWFCALHDELAPTPEESAARLRDFVRMLPAAPGPIADLALREIRRVDEASPIPLATFAEAADAAAFRPEKRLVKSALVWMGKTARPHGRQDAAVLAVLPLFASEALDLRERAVKLVAKHAAGASAPTREAAVAASADLPADLRALIPGAALPEEKEAPGRPVDSLPPYTPPAPAPPIGSPGELAEELMVWQGTGWGDLERVMTGIVEQGHRDPEATRTALAQVANTHPWLLNRVHDQSGEEVPLYLVGLAFGSLTPPPETTGVRALAKVMRSRLRQMSRATPDPWERHDTRHPLPYRFLIRRMLEALDSPGWKPFLLATPTEANGLIDPDVLVDRALRYEADGLEIGPADLGQALLRTPRTVGSDALRRAGGLTSGPGRSLAEYLGSDAPPLSEVSVAPVTVRRRYTFRPLEITSTRLLAASSPLATAAPLEIVRPLYALPRGEYWNSLPTLGYWSGYDVVPRMLPSHRELAAAHLLPAVSGVPEVGDPSWERPEIGDAVLALAEADGPAGPATGAVLAYAASDKQAAGRSLALEALLVLASRNLLPAADLGAAIATLVELDGVKLNRITDVLGEAVHAGAYAEVWDIARAALPPLLARVATEKATNAPKGLADLLQLAARCAETVGVRAATMGARAEVPGLADVAARGGSSRLVREAVRLQRTLNPER